MTEKPQSASLLVSIGLPVYNGETYLEQAVRSLLAQSYANFELIISDNCSTDSTEKICQALAREDPRILYSRTERNLGAAGNFNRVVGIANGDLFAWANHDDLWHPDYVSSCVAALLRDSKSVLAYAQSAKIDDTGEIIHALNCNLGLDGRTSYQRLKRYHDIFIDLDLRCAWSKEPIEGLWIPVYGVMHTPALRQTKLIGNYISSDTVLIEDLLLLGSFTEVDKLLFFKRDHQSRSMRDSEAYDARAVWFTGQPRARFILPRWRTLRERVVSAQTLPDGSASKLRCLLEVQSYYWRRRSERNALVKEILANLSRLILGPERGARFFPKW